MYVCQSGWQIKFYACSVAKIILCFIPECVVKIMFCLCLSFSLSFYFSFFLSVKCVKKFYSYKNIGLDDEYGYDMMVYLVGNGISINNTNY